MSRFLHHSVAAAATLTVALTLGSCGGGSSGGFGILVASASIGPGGGQVTSADGLLVLDIPAGALGTAQTIKISTLAPGQGSAALQALAPGLAWKLEPDGLQFALPVALTIDLPFPVASVPGSLDIQLPAVMVVSAGVADLVDVPQAALDVAAGIFTARGELSHFSELGVATTSIVNPDVRATLVYPTTLQSGTSAPATASLDISGGVDSVLWFAGADSGNIVVTEPQLEFGPPGMVYDPTAGPTIVQDTITLACPQGGTGGVFSVVISLGLADPLSGAHESLFALVLRNLSVKCESGSPGPGPPTLISLANILFDVEATLTVPPVSDCFDPVAPQVWVAGRDPNSGAAAVLVDTKTGAVAQSKTYAATGNAFDVVPITSSTGLTEGLYTTGSGGFLDTLTAGCQLSPGFQLGMGFREDTSQIALAGGGIAAASAGAFAIVLATMDDIQGPTTTAINLPGPVNSVIGNATLDAFLVVRANLQQLILVQLAGGNPGQPTETPAGNLGSLPRRIRWDPATGFGGITDFSDATVTLFIWDGQTVPTIFATVPVGLGPVGLDVFGQFVVCAGFTDDTWTLIEADLVTQAVVGAVTSPLPFPTPAIMYNPGHAMFLRDTDGTVVFSFFGDDSLGVFPGVLGP